MENGYELSFTAEQINVNLGNAEKAILYTEQTLTPEQQTQARENIGAGSEPVVIDLDEMGISELLVYLFNDGGGDIELGENTNWQPWDVLNTRKPVTAHCTLAAFDAEYNMANTTITFSFSEGKAVGFSFEITVLFNNELLCISVSIYRPCIGDGTGTYGETGKLLVRITTLEL